jgi:hypothetical protein
MDKRIIQFIRFQKYGSYKTSPFTTIMSLTFNKGDSLEIIGESSTAYHVIDPKTNGNYWIDKNLL